MSYALDQKLKIKVSFNFLQIGDNDGFANDPLFRFIKRYSSKGIILEPQKDVFENRLKKTYRFKNNLILENIAVANETGERKLYKLSISNSRWATGLATFDREVLENQIKGTRVRTKAKNEGVSIPNNFDWIFRTKLTPSKGIKITAFYL